LKEQVVIFYHPPTEKILYKNDTKYCTSLLTKICISIIQGAAFNVTHFQLAILLVLVVGGVVDNGGWAPCGLGFSEKWNVGPCSSAYFVWNSSC
jgi:hypothetical protein